MPKANESKPKPWRGWAVFDETGQMHEESLSKIKRYAWCSYHGGWEYPSETERLTKLGYTVRRVIVTPEEGK